MKLIWRNFNFDFSLRTYVMGVLNVTPDSFSDGGLFLDASAAIGHAIRMVEDGVDIIDIGGESTRPGSDAVTIEEELRRTLPVIQAITKEISVPVSIDTYKAEVAKRALDAGASMVNDISGLGFDPAMPGVVSEYEVPVVVMHIKGTPKDMQKDPVYEALLPEIYDSLRRSMQSAMDAGIPENMIVIDPGIGFGKTFDHNLEILHRLREFTLLERPILVGVSRKAFIGKVLENASVENRLEGTAAAVAISIMNGANIVRVHDVKEMARVARVADAIRRMRINNL
jgi:dihydropteroate synthase